MPTALSGYFYFLRDGWRLPLFDAAGLGGVDGTSIIFTDSIPLVALLGRLVKCLTGLTVNLYGVWTAICFVGSALSMTWLVALLGQQSIASTVAATVVGLCMPALLFRWGHLPLMAQFEIVLALAFAVVTKRHCRPLSCFVISTVLCLLALWTNAYLFVMVSGIVGATIGQALLDRALSPHRGLALIASVAALILGAILLSGHLSGKNSLSGFGFGYYSTNLLSPLAAQMSGVLFWKKAILDGTGGQYEGFAYLGLGVLLLVFSTLPVMYEYIARSCKRFPLLIVVLFAFAIFALSNRIYIGSWEMAGMPLPDAILKIAGIFRSSGRFVWPILYGTSAMAIVATTRRHGRAGAVVLLTASVLQWADTSPLRVAVAASVAAPAPLPLDAALWRPAIARHSFIRVLPSFGCLSIEADRDREVAMEVQLLSSLAGVPTNTVYAGRPHGDCAAEQHVEPRIETHEMRIYLHGSQGLTHVNDAAGGQGQCITSPKLVLCSAVLDDAAMRTLLHALIQQESLDSATAG